MAIKDAGEWLVGSEPEDIRSFLDSYTEDTYRVHEYRQSRCGCGSLRFSLWVDEEECSAKRRCADCGKEEFIFDGEEYWSGEHAELCACGACDDPKDLCNVGVGYSLYEEPSNDGSLVAVKWIFIGFRCVACGVLGCVGDWKIGSEMPKEMLDQV